MPHTSCKTSIQLKKIHPQYDIHGNITTLTEAEGIEALRRYYDGVNDPRSTRTGLKISGKDTRNRRDQCQTNRRP